MTLKPNRSSKKRGVKSRGPLWILLLLLLICLAAGVYFDPLRVRDQAVRWFSETFRTGPVPSGDYYSFLVHGEQIPVYYGRKWITLNGNRPYFTEEEKNMPYGFARYENLDELERATGAFARISRENLPTAEREQLFYQPTGWKQNQYDFIDNGGWLYNRCHLLAYSLTGQQDNPLNMITGTRQLNLSMLGFEVEAVQYIENYNGSCLYRVTPYYEGNNLLASGVLMESESLEFAPDATFCVFVYNCQDGVMIDYATGENWLAAE